MRNFIRDPFFHFVVLGALLFIGHAIWSAKFSSEARVIYVSESEMQRQALIFAGENRRTANDDDLKALLYAYVEEETLVREARVRGLGEGDTILRRRLAQKMRFLLEDVSPPKLPSDAVLKTWFEERADEFAQPLRLSFTHIYFSPEAGNPDARAAKVRAALGADDDGAAMGDPFIMRREYKDVTPIDTARLFGPAFSKSLETLEDGQWSQGIESAFGLHLVKITSQIPAEAANFSAVKDSVSQAWLEAKQRSDNAERLQNILAKYTVKVEGE